MVHTYKNGNGLAVIIRVISTRTASKNPIQQYERGKFYKPNVEPNLPIYLDVEVQDYLYKRAKAKDTDLNQIVNDLLRKDIAIIEG